MIERIPHGIWYRLCPFFEFFPAASSARDVILVHAVSSQRAPFVVVAAQPYFRNVCKFMVLSHLLWDEVAMVVYDGKIFRTFMI